MVELKESLRELCLISAISGREKPVAQAMQRRFSEQGLHAEIDVLGNCMTTVSGLDTQRPSVMVFGHMDQLGFIVRKIEPDGFLRIERLGGVPERIMPALTVHVITRQGGFVPGVIGLKAHHATTAEEKTKVRPVGDSYVDIGATCRQEVLSLGIDIGSAVVYAPRFTELLGGRICATSLDNRVACAVLLALAEKLKNNPVDSTVHLVGTVQEEYNVRGAVVAARRNMPAAAICIDVCLDHGTPDMKDLGEVQLGEGPVLSLYNFHGRGTLNGVIPHEDMVELFEKASEEQGIAVQRAVTLGLLTDLAYVQFENLGLKAIDIGIPCRYTHSPSEICCLSDVEQTVELIYSALKLLPCVQ